MNYYFTEVHEKAVVEYLQTKDSKLFSQVLYPALNKLAKGLLHSKYKTLPEYLKTDIEADIVTFLYTKLHCFNPDNNSKAFNYYTQICDNYILQRIKENKKALSTHTPLTDAPDEIDTSLDEITTKQEQENKLQLIQKAYSILSEPERIIYNLYFSEELSMKAVADKCAVSTYVVFRIVRDIRSKIRTHLQIHGILENLSYRKTRKKK